MSSPQAKNLEMIQGAIDHHSRTCDGELLEIRMNPFEFERLGWEEYRGIPIVADGQMPTGRFRLVCSGQHSSDEPVDAVSADNREQVYV